jgi:hypothetical protein
VAEHHLTRLPIHAPVLNQQHLAAPATQLQRADEAVVQERPGVLMFGGVHLLQRRVEQPFLFVAGESPIANP